MYARITKDKLWEPGDSLPSREGEVIVDHHNGEFSGTVLDVRLLDDDREHYYTAVADDDALEALFDWAMFDAGCTILQVKDEDGNWKDEIA